MKYRILDVFCREKYSGNQLAVVFADKDLTKAEMQSIAGEFHFSETTFIFPDDRPDGAYRVRIFTPYEEVPFAGHPTLGTAFVIRNEVEKHAVNEVTLALDVGKISVTFDDVKDLQWMRQIEPVFGPAHNRKQIAHIIGVSEDVIDERFPVQGVSTGIEFLIIPLKNLQAVKTAATNLSLFKEYFHAARPMPLFIFSPETYETENAINCRMFAEAFGIPEDPATGSANGCLAAYLTHHQYFGSEPVDITVEQGYEIGRKSILHLKSHLENGAYNIRVGGKVVKTAEGILM